MAQLDVGGGAVGPRSVEHHLSAESAAVLERYEGSSLLAEGKLNLIGLDAITERFGSRWALRREGVYDLVERALERHLGDEGYFTRVSDSDYLIVQPGRSRYAGQVACLRCLQELLRHFLGRMSDLDVRVCEVTKLSRHGIEAAPIDPRALREAAAESRSFDPLDEAPPAPAAAPQRPPSFLASSGQRIRVSAGVEPVYCMTKQALIGHRLERHVWDEGSGRLFSEAELLRLARADIERIDLAAMAAGVARLPPGDVHPGLIVPVTFASLACQHGRTLMAAAFQNIRQQTGRSLVCELIDVEGAPTSALAEAVNLIRPHCTFAIARLLEPTRQLAKSVREAGLQGASITCPSHVGGDAEFIGWARGAIALARRAARSVLVFGILGQRRGAMAQLLGASHIGLRARPVVDLDAYR